MIILGALVNGIAACAGGVCGLLGRRWVNQKLGDFLMQGLGLCIILVAVNGMIQGSHIVVTVLSLVIGGLLGYWLDIDAAIHKFGDWTQDKINAACGGNAGLGRFTDGFVPSSLFICVGAMAILGSLKSGLELDHSTLFAKALIDFVVVAIMASTLGIGVPFSGLCVFVYEALLSIGASWLAPILTAVTIDEMVCAGSLLLLAIGLNMLKVADIKVANFLPAAFAPILLCLPL